MFTKKHAILELASIPRDRAQLQHVINEARAEQRKARMMYIAAVVAFVAALIVLFMWYRGQVSAAPLPAASVLQQVLYLPIAIR